MSAGDLSYNNDTDSFDMRPQVEEAIRRALDHLAHVEEEATKQGLIALGWMPPDGVAKLTMLRDGRTRALDESGDERVGERALLWSLSAILNRYTQ